MKIASQNNGSMVEGMMKTVARPMMRPNSDSCTISFQFMRTTPAESYSRRPTKASCRLGRRHESNKIIFRQQHMLGRRRQNDAHAGILKVFLTYSMFALVSAITS